MDCLSYLNVDTKKRLNAYCHSGLLFTKRMDILPPSLVKSRSRSIEHYNNRIALQYDRHLGNIASYVPVKFQMNWSGFNPSRAPFHSRLTKYERMGQI